MARKKVEDNHKIVSAIQEQSAAEELIEQQGLVLDDNELGVEIGESDQEADQDTVEAKSEQDTVEAKSEQDTVEAKSEQDITETQEVQKGNEQNQGEQENEKEQISKEKGIVLMRAASYFGCGQRFFKNQPEKVSEEVFAKLMGTNLFEGI